MTIPQGASGCDDRRRGIQARRCCFDQSSLPADDPREAFEALGDPRAPRLAGDRRSGEGHEPANAIVNYLYAIVEAEARLAALPERTAA